MRFLIIKSEWSDNGEIYCFKNLVARTRGNIVYWIMFSFQMWFEAEAKIRNQFPNITVRFILS